MGEDVKYEAVIIIQRGDEMGANEYLLQLDVDKSGRVFVPLNRIILAVKDGSFPMNRGEHFYDSNKESGSNE